MSKIDFKEACRLFWMVKGHLNTTETVIMECYDGYFKRMWYSEESYVHTEGFEEAWEKKYGSQQNQRTEPRRSELSGGSTACRTSQKLPTEIITNTQAA